MCIMLDIDRCKVPAYCSPGSAPEGAECLLVRQACKRSFSFSAACFTHSCCSSAMYPASVPHMQGELPFKSSGQSDLAKQVCSGRYPPMNGVSSSCRDVVAKMLTVQPAERISLESIRRHPWTEGCNPDEDVGSSDTALGDDEVSESQMEAAEERMQRSLHLVLPSSLASAADDEVSKAAGSDKIRPCVGQHASVMIGCDLACICKRIPLKHLLESTASHEGQCQNCADEAGFYQVPCLSYSAH